MGFFVDIRVIERKEIKVVGMAWNGPYSQSDKILNLFAVMEARIEEIPYQLNNNILMAPFHNRETELTYYVTTPVEKIEFVPEGMIGFTIPEKSYVFGIHNGSSADVKNTYERIFNWMEEYGYEQDHHALCMEIYYTDIPFYHTNHEPLQFEIYLPIKKYIK